jgi:hypothetical protein
MNAIKRFLIKKFFKMDKLDFMLKLAAHYNQFELTEPEDKKRNRRIQGLIDVMADDFLNKEFPLEPERKPKEDPKPVTTALKTEGVVKSPVVIEKKKDEPPEEVMVTVKPFYSCSIVLEKGKEAKPIEFTDIRLNLPAFKDEDSAKQFKNTYPTVEFLEMVLDDAWDKASKGIPNSAINEDLKKELKGYYNRHGLSTNDDFYKLTNAYSKLVKILRMAFGESKDDRNVTVTRPGYTAYIDQKKKIVFTKEADCFVSKPPADPATIKAETVFDKKDKPEMKTVQTQKKDTDSKELKPSEDVVVPKTTIPKTEVPETKVSEPDEEEQETGTSPEAEASSEAAEVEEPEENNEGKAPGVNAFDNFNDIETLVFNKLKEGNLKASKETNTSKQMAIKGEAREDAKLLIQSRFDSEEWANKDDKGLWKPEFMRYWNAILKEIGTRANAK